MLEPPEGERRGAYYTRRHLEQLLLIRKWQAAGVSLERIGRLLKGEVAGLPPESEPGTVEVWSRIMLQPGRLGLMPEQTQALIERLIAVANEWPTA